jgi:hypothetical protein
MANRTYLKTFTYNRANFGIWGGGNSLERELISSHQIVPDVSEREFIHNNERVKGYSVDVLNDNGGLLLHIVTYEAGMPASVIEQEGSDVSTHESPINKDYLNKEVYAFIKGDHVIICNHNARDSILLSYLKHILHKSGSVEASENLMIEKIGDVDKLQLIENEGIKEVHLNTSLYKASLDYLNQNNPNKSQSLLTSIGSNIAGLFRVDGNNSIREDENLNVRLTISFDGREARSHLAEPAFGASGKERLLKTAKSVLDADQDDFFDDYELITGQGKSIKFNSVKVHNKQRVNRIGNSLSRQDVWSKLCVYYNTLKENGIIEQ